MLTLLTEVAAVLDATADQALARLSALLEPLIPHHALASLTDGCARSPLNVHGVPQVTAALSVPALTRLTAESRAGSSVRRTELAGEQRWVVTVAASSAGEASILVVVCRGNREPSPEACGTAGKIWAVISANLAQRIDHARPEDLGVARAVARERTRLVAELKAGHEAALLTLLGVLRADKLDDGTARRSATDLAAAALIALRTNAEHEHAIGDEPADRAFSLLRRGLQPMLRYSDVDLSLAAPDSHPPLPAEIAQAGRAITRNAVLAMLGQDKVTRIRVGWTAGDGLTIMIHDDGPGRLTAGAPAMLEVISRAEAVGGTAEFEGVPDWGSRLVAWLPLKIPARAADDPLDQLHPREREVLELVAAGRHNREIATTLHISENTVKYHVGNILRKLNAGSRVQAAALARQYPAARTAGGRVVELPQRSRQSG
jgi:DNA-binding CsgD family transcriptional regulator